MAKRASKFITVFLIIGMLVLSVWLYQKYSHPKISPSNVKEKEQVIITPHTDEANKAKALDGDGGHSWADHGAHVTEAQQIKRLQTGITPGRSHRDIPALVSNFTSDHMHLIAYEDALKKLPQLTRGGRMKQTVVINGKGFEYMGISYRFDKNGNLQKQKVNGYRAVFRYNKKYNSYKLLTLFPQ